MPRMNDTSGASTLAKLLLIGDGKLGKTYYAALAAKAGFNVLYLDGDVGAATISSMVKSGALTSDEASRIYLLDIRDTIMGGMRDTKMTESIDELFSSIVVRWNDTLQRMAKRNDTGEIWELRLGKMGQNDLLIVDSWTGYTDSLMLAVARANNVDISTAKTPEMRPVYQGASLKATQTLQVIRSVPCHVIVIAHPDEYSHMTNPEGRKVGAINEKDKTIDWTKMIPKTTSKPQGLLMSKYFTDVAWIELSPDGKERRLNFKPKNDRVSGGHFDDIKSIEEYSFANLVKQIGGRLPDGEGPAWISITTVDAPTQADEKILDGTTPSAVQGMSGMFSKSK